MWSAVYTLASLQQELNRWGPKYYSKNGKEPLLFLTVLLLSLQFQRALQFMLKEEMFKNYRLDGIHLAIALHFCQVRQLAVLIDLFTVQAIRMHRNNLRTQAALAGIIFVTRGGVSIVIPLWSTAEQYSRCSWQPPVCNAATPICMQLVHTLALYTFKSSFDSFGNWLQTLEGRGLRLGCRKSAVLWEFEPSVQSVLLLSIPVNRFIMHDDAPSACPICQLLAPLSSRHPLSPPLHAIDFWLYPSTTD